jgi:hypothetical protein
MCTDFDGCLVETGTFEGRFIASVVVSGTCGHEAYGDEVCGRYEIFQAIHDNAPNRKVSANA